LDRPAEILTFREESPPLSINPSIPTGEVVMRGRTGNFNNARVPQKSGVAGPFVVPRLEELVADPDQVRVLDAHTTRGLRTRALAALNVLNGHDLDLAVDGISVHRHQSRDRLLDVFEAAEKLGVTTDWLYRHHRKLPITVRHGRLLRFSELGIDDYIRRRRG
jgi:predicted DNA-binding transcriptional regulator AlpA